MHIVDGVLSPEVCAMTAALSTAAVGYSLHRLKQTPVDRIVPFTGMMAAVVFAGQMVNFPLVGTMVSGHLMGGVLAAVILGPWAGCVALTLVLLVQCLMFSDGGLLSLGANVLHMAVIGSIGGYAVFATVRRLLGTGLRGTVAGSVMAAWLSVMAAAAVFCLEFRLSWPSEAFDFSRIFTLMVTFHSGIGLGEALITGFAVSFVCLHRPGLIGLSEAPARGEFRWGLVGSGLLLALAIAAFLAPFASGHPDGLEAVAERAEFMELEQAGTALLLEDYEIPALVGSWSSRPLWQVLSVSIAGIGGTLSVFLLTLLLDRLLRRRLQSTATGFD